MYNDILLYHQYESFGVSRRHDGRSSSWINELGFFQDGTILDAVLLWKQFLYQHFNGV
jgi:hypothetical protein